MDAAPISDSIVLFKFDIYRIRYSSFGLSRVTVQVTTPLPIIEFGADMCNLGSISSSTLAVRPSSAVPVIITFPTS